MDKKIAVLIPCYNEELTIEKVINDVKDILPEARIFVYDNNSTDNTYEIAEKSNVTVKKEYRQGKGNVVKSMFRDIDADYYIMIDGDDTYPLEYATKLLSSIIENDYDMVIGDRHTLGEYKQENKRIFHNFGNHLVKNIINKLYKTNLKDIMSGFRIFNRKFVKNFPVNSKGFEIETEMTIHALDKEFRVGEVEIGYRDRPIGSVSKLNTISDGMRVIKTIFWLFKDYRPLTFFSSISLIFFILSLSVGIPVIIEFFHTSLVTKIPSAILSVGLMLISIGSLFSGFLLDTIVKNYRNLYNLRIIDWIQTNKKED